MASKTKIALLIASFLIIDALFINCSNNSEEKLASTDVNSFYAKKIAIDSSKFKLGQFIFNLDCIDCHAGKHRTDNILIDNIVQGVGEKYLKLFLTKEDSLVAAKNKYTVSLKAEFGNLANSHNFKYSDEQLNAIIEYLK